MKNNILPSNATPFNNAYIVYVTPELAKKWLEEANVFNRPINQSVVDLYVRQIKAGLWRRTHQGIAFDFRGLLIDGQHRLMAIVITGQTVAVLVFVEEPMENFEFIDCGRNRSNLETMRMASHNNMLSLIHTSTIKSMIAGRYCKTVGRFSNAELNKYYAKYGAAVDFAVEQLGDYSNKQINDPTVRGVIARACYHLNKNVLVEFCSLLKGQSSEHPAAKMVDAFRRCLINWEGRKEITRRDIYMRCEHILKAMQDKKEIVGFPVASGELFPINHDNC